MSNRSALRLAATAAGLLLAALLCSCAKPAATPGEVVDRFYALRVESGSTGVPDRRELQAMETYLGAELRSLLEQARQRRDDEAARAPAEKPAFADGDLFSSLFEGPTSFKVGADETTGDVHRISVQLANDRQQPVVSWTDRAVVRIESGTPVITDIEYGGNWEFGNRGALVSMLKNALTPAVAAGILGEWTIAGHRIPGASAMNDAQAKALHGQALKYSPETASSGRDVCPNAGYRHRTEDATAFLAAGYRTTPRALGLQAGDSKLEITEVNCGGVPWPTLGGALLQTGKHTFAPWNGVFFELQRR